MTVGNNGPSDSTGSTVTDVLAPGVTFDGGASSGSCSEAGGIVTCGVGAIAAGGSAVLTVVVDLDSSLANGSTLTNDASVTANEADTVAANDVDSVTVTVNTEANLAVSKTDNVDPVIAGSGLLYTVTATNNGPSDALAVTLVDSLPSGVSYVSAVPSIGSCSESGGTITCVFGTIAAGASESVVIAVTVPSDTAAGTTLTNDATVTSATTDPDASDNSISEDTTVNTNADLSITKIDSVDPANAGDPLTYTVTVTNNGPSDALSVAAVDTLPVGVAYVSATATQGSCVEAGLVVTCTIGTVATGASVTATVNVTIDADVADGSTLTNNAVVSSATTDPVGGNDATSEDTTVGTQADLSITKTDAPDPAIAGSNLVYTISVSNQGPSDAQSVVVTDVLPVGLAYVSATASQGSCVEVAGTVTCALGTVADGVSATITVNVDVDPDLADGSSIMNTATVASSTSDPDMSDNTSTATTSIETSADISVVKSDSADPVTAGTTLTYTVAVSNLGPSDAQAVQAVDLLPADVSYLSYSVAGGSGGETCAHVLGTVTCDLGVVVVGGTETITIVVAVDASATDSDFLANVASISTSTTDPNALNDAVFELTAVSTEADLSVVKVDSADPVNAGSGFSYTVTVSNAGPSDAAGVTLVDVLPGEVSFAGAAPDQGSCSESAGTVTCALGTIADGGSVDIVIDVTVPPDTSAGTITNNVSVSTSTTDPVAPNDATSEDTSVTTSADLAVSKSDSADPVTAGTGLSYTVNVSNAGPSDAAGVVLTDVLPAGLVFVSAVPAQGTCSEAALTVTCPLGVVADGASVDVIITVTVPSGASAGTITNNDSVAAVTADPVPGNDVASEDTTISVEADVSVVKVDSADPVAAGASFSYTVTVFNAGPSDATAVVLTDVLPGLVTYTGAVPDQGSCSEVGGTVTCLLGTIADGDSVDVVITVVVDVGVVAGTVLTNSASVVSTSPDPVPLNNSDSEDTTVQEVADLSVAKVDLVDPVVAGTNVTYTVTVTNGGPSGAQSVVLTDTLPGGTSYVSAVPDQGTCSELAGVVTCPLGTLADGASVDVVIVAAVAPVVADGTTLTNVASVVSTTSEPTPGDNSTSEDTLITAAADISVTKVDSVDPVLAGANLSYTVTVSNGGPSDAQTVVLTDTLPGGTNYVSAVPDQGTCSEAAGVVTCSLGAIAGGASIDVVIATALPSSTPAGTMTNTASVTTTTTDPDASNDSTSEDTEVALTADLAVTKVDNVDPVLAGTNLTYTVTASNNGPSDAAGVTVVDTLPAGLTFVSATPAQGSCAEAGGVVTCPVGTIVDGGSVDIVIVVSIPSTTLEATVLTNDASVGSAVPDPIVGNDTTSENTTVTAEADLSISKVDSTDPVTAGSGLSYTVTIANLGPSTAQSVGMTDVPPSGITFVSATPDQGSCSFVAGTVFCSLGAIDTGVSVDVVINVAVPSDTAAGTITNNASTSSPTTDPVAGNDATSEDTTITTSADVSVAKVDSADPVVAGTGFSYAVTVSNAGPSDAVGVSLVDVLPAEVSFVSATPDQGSCSELAGTVTCALGSIASGGSVDVVINVAVPSDTAAGTVTNNASVSSATSDPVAGNNATSEDTTITTSADVSVAKVDPADPVVAGAGLSYTVSVTNAGPSDAVAVGLVDVLPAEVLFVSATPDQGSCSEVAGTVTCGLGTIASGGSVDVVIVVAAPADAAAGTITNNASVSSATSDPVAANDATSEDTTIVMSADVSVVEVDSADPVFAGSGFSYTVTVSNAGPSDAAGVSVVDVLPAEVSFVSATPDQGSCSEVAGTVTCGLGTIAS